MALAFRARRRAKAGTFRPLHLNKYLGTKLPTYRSSYERAFFRFCDQNNRVLKWGSEINTIPYMNPIDKKVHRYIVDNFVLLKDSMNEIHKYLVEIKPANQIKMPIQKSKKRNKRLIFEQLQYAENMAKWDAARQWCQKNQCKFLILNEYDLGIKKHS